VWVLASLFVAKGQEWRSIPAAVFTSGICLVASERSED
jgi:hypothetical protein